MTPPLHISKFTSCCNKANSVVRRKAVRNAAYSDQGCFKLDNTLNTCTNCAYICSDPLPIHTLPTMSVANYIVIPAHGTLCSSYCWLQIGLAPYSLYS